MLLSSADGSVSARKVYVSWTLCRLGFCRFCHMLEGWAKWFSPSSSEMHLRHTYTKRDVSSVEGGFYEQLSSPV